MRKSTIVARLATLEAARAYAAVWKELYDETCSVAHDAVSGGWLVLVLEDKDA